MAEQVVTNAPWEPQQPYLTFGFGQAQDLYNQGAPQYFPGSTVAPFSDTTNQAMDMYRGMATSGNPITPAAQQQVGDTLSGNYLNSNPYLDSMYDNAASAVTRHYNEAVAPGINQQFANSGRTGSGLFANAHDSARDTLSRNLSGMASNIYGQNYQQERARQMQAAGMAPQTANLGYLDASQLLNVGNLEDTKAQQQLTDDFNRYQYNTLSPWDNLGRYMGNIRGTYGGESVSDDGISGLQSGLGFGLAGLGLLNEVGGVKGLGGLLGF